MRSQARYSGITQSKLAFLFNLMLKLVKKFETPCTTSTSTSITTATTYYQ